MFGCDLENEVENTFFLFSSYGKTLIFLVIPNSHVNKNFHSQHEYYVEQLEK